MPVNTGRNDSGGQKTLHEGRYTVVGVFARIEDAEQALRALHDAGFSRKDLSLVTKGTEAAEEIPSQAESERAVQGAEKGAVIGGILGGLVGVAALAIPGVGPIAAAGWLAALGGAAVGAAAGGLIGALAKLGVPEDVAQRYAQQLTQGNVLVMVHVQDKNGEAIASRLLGEAGSEDVVSYPYEAHPEEIPGDETYLAEAQLHQSALSTLDPTQVAERLQVGMVVVGSDGEVVGEVKRVRASNFLVDRPLHSDIYIPFSVVHDITGKDVALTIPSYEVNRREQPARPGIVEAGEDWTVEPLFR